MDAVTVGVREGRVALLNQTLRLGVGLEWRKSDEVSTCIAKKARGLVGPEAEIFGPVTVKREGEQIIIEYQGKTLMMAPIATAHEIAMAMKSQARRLEELEAFEGVVFDQAILQRTGMPFGLTSNPKLQAEAGKEAAWNSELRRYIPGGRLRQRQVGTPGVRRIDGNTERR